MSMTRFLDRGVCIFENVTEADAIAVAGAERRKLSRRRAASYSIYVRVIADDDCNQRTLQAAR